MGDKRYDLVGDIHGYADELESLLISMGYVPDGKGYVHPERTLIFVGDLIDRGAKQKRVVEIAQKMVKEGHAIVLMGNHEFNAISYATALGNGEYARPHTHRNNKNHKAFLDEFPFDSPEYHEVINFFKSMLLWLDMEEFRVIHACWHEASMRALKPFIDDMNRIQSDDVYRLVGNDVDPCFSSVEILLKGPEFHLPEGKCFIDHGGVRRDKARVKWWNLNIKNDDVLDADPTLITGIDFTEEYSGIKEYAYSEKDPVIFFGHYWQKEKEGVLKHQANSACLDWSVAKGGKLHAYRWNGNLSESDWF